MKKRLLFLVLISVFLITGCLSKEQKKQKREYEAQAKPIAVEYIKSKYNIDAKVITAEADIAGISVFDEHLSGLVYVQVKDGSKTFVVKVDVKGEQPSGDTYQNDIIEKDCIKKLKSIFGIEPIYFDSYVKLDGKFKHLVYYTDYYDGTNIEKYFPKFEAGFINAEVGEEIILQLNSLVNEESNYSSDYLTIYNFKSKKAYEKSLEHTTGSDIGIPETIYLKGYYKYVGASEGVGYYDVNLKEDNIVLAKIDYANKKISSANYTIEKMDQSIIDDITKYYSTPYETIINAIKYNDKNIDVLYLKQSKYGQSTKINAIHYCENENGGYNSISNAYLIGDYLYFYVSPSNNCINQYILVLKTK